METTRLTYRPSRWMRPSSRNLSGLVLRLSRRGGCPGRGSVGSAKLCGLIAPGQPRMSLPRGQPRTFECCLKLLGAGTDSNQSPGTWWSFRCTGRGHRRPLRAGTAGIYELFAGRMLVVAVLDDSQDHVFLLGRLRRTYCPGPRGAGKPGVPHLTISRRSLFTAPTRPPGEGFHICTRLEVCGLGVPLPFQMSPSSTHRSARARIARPRAGTIGLWIRSGVYLLTLSLPQLAAPRGHLAVRVAIRLKVQIDGTRARSS